MPEVCIKDYCVDYNVALDFGMSIDIFLLTFLYILLLNIEFVKVFGCISGGSDGDVDRRYFVVEIIKNPVYYVVLDDNVVILVLQMVSFNIQTVELHTYFVQLYNTIFVKPYNIIFNG